ncbi:MAG: hypothetical protein BWY32_02579 [bacterium ADurb.Bin243]|nr:MAG: hypothetical protein BWY32_02579 [bacterium ADurb.Bin243]
MGGLRRIVGAGRHGARIKFVMKARVAEPSLVDDDFYPAFMGFFDDVGYIVYEPVVSAVGEKQDLYFLAHFNGFIHGFDYSFFRDRPEYSKIIIYRRHKVYWFRAAYYYTVMHGFMAVAVQYDAFAGFDQRLKEYLIRSGRAVGRKESAPRAEGARRKLLRFLYDAFGIEQRIEHRH